MSAPTEPPPTTPEQLPDIPIGVGSKATLTGFLAAVVAFITAWAQDGLTPETVTLGASAVGILAAFFIGRSLQASSLYKRVEPIVGQARSAVGEVTDTISRELPPAPPEKP